MERNNALRQKTFGGNTFILILSFTGHLFSWFTIIIQYIVSRLSYPYIIHFVIIEHLISPWTKWPPFLRRYFQMPFHEKFRIFV